MLISFNPGQDRLCILHWAEVGKLANNRAFFIKCIGARLTVLCFRSAHDNRRALVLIIGSETNNKPEILKNLADKKLHTFIRHSFLNTLVSGLAWQLG